LNDTKTDIFIIGAAGSGHFTKMVHNGIEYGMMQSIAEGFEVLNILNFDIDFENSQNRSNQWFRRAQLQWFFTENAFKRPSDSIRIMHSP
jgi:6-phosphogluconate dehydrogenase